MLKEVIIISSKRRIRKKSCTKKKRFDSFKEGNQKLHTVNYMAIQSGGIERILYKCTFCNGYHIGFHKKGRRNRKRPLPLNDSMERYTR